MNFILSICQYVRRLETGALRLAFAACGTASKLAPAGANGAGNAARFHASPFRRGPPLLSSIGLCLCLAACSSGGNQDAILPDASSGSGSQAISLVSGNIGGYGWVDATGTSARFNGPESITRDSLGNLYIVDKNNHTIRKMTPAGVVSTLAGKAGSTGNTDGTGAAARFNNPSGIAADASGNLYVADTDNHTIRMITPAGVVSTFAGTAGAIGNTDGTGVSARFWLPTGITVDASGDLYVADSANQAIRKITPAGVVSTFAGSGTIGNTDATGTAAQFFYPHGITAGTSGNLYVADTSNHTIRKITSAGVVTTFAGTSGVAGNADGTGTAAQFNQPGNIAADAFGNLYVADTSNHTIRKITSAGVVSTFAGTPGFQGNADGIGPAAHFIRPGGITVDAAGNVHVPDNGGSTIRMITPAGVVTTVAGAAGIGGFADGSGGAAQFLTPQGITADAFGNLYVADMSGMTIRKITPAGVVSTFAGQGTVFGNADGTGAAAAFLGPNGITVDASGDLYVAEVLASTIRKITAAAVVTNVAGSTLSTGSTDATGTAARFDDPAGIAADQLGNLFVADTKNHAIRRIVIATRVVTTFAGMAGVPGTADANGTAAQFNKPSGIAADAVGNLYVADTENNTIRKITPAGAVTTLAGTAGVSGSVDGTGTAAQFNKPSAITVDTSGNLYVADTGNHTIRKIALTSGVVTTVAGVAGQRGVLLGALPGSLSLPAGLTFIDANTLAVTTAQGVVSIMLP